MPNPFDDLTAAQRQQIREAHAAAKMKQQEPRRSYRIVAEYCPGCGETHYPARTGAAEYCRTCQYYGRDRAAQQEENR